MNGDFVLTATLQHLTLTQLTSCIHGITLPHGMGTVDLGTVQVIAAQSGGALTLSAAASNANLGEFAFKAQKSGTWGAAFGFEVNTGGIAALPGLRNTSLATFDSFIGLSNLLLVLSTFDAPSFDFPDVVSFNGSTFIGAGRITLPGSGGLQTGLNIFASIATNNSPKGAAAQLTKRLHLDSLSAALSVSLPDPLTSSQLYLSFTNVAILKNVLLNGSFGGRLASSSVGVFFNGSVQAPPPAPDRHLHRAGHRRAARHRPQRQHADHRRPQLRRGHGQVQHPRSRRGDRHRRRWPAQPRPRRHV